MNPYDASNITEVATSGHSFLDPGESARMFQALNTAIEADKDLAVITSTTSFKHVGDTPADANMQFMFKDIDDAGVLVVFQLDEFPGLTYGAVAGYPRGYAKQAETDPAVGPSIAEYIVKYLFTLIDLDGAIL